MKDIKSFITESNETVLVKRMLKENVGTSLRKYMNTVYKKDPYNSVHNDLDNDKFVKKHGWFRVWHEGYGEGICSPSEGIVAVFDEDDLDTYSDVEFYRYNPKAWVKTDGDGWDRIYNGENGAEYEVEPID